MNINSSSTFSVSPSTNKGMSGMISGLDTESWVEQMLSGTQSKIDKQQGLKWQAEERQVMYRDVISSINGLHSKYFDTKYDSQLTNNFASKNFFDSMMSKVSGSGVSVISTSSSAQVGNMDIKIHNLAKAANVTGTINMSDQSTAITSKAVDITDFEKKITIAQDGNSVDVDLSTAKNSNDIINLINQEIKKTGSALENSGIEASIYDGRLRLTTSVGAANLTVSGSDLGMKMTGLGSYEKNLAGNRVLSLICSRTTGVVTDSSGNTSEAKMLNGGSKINADYGVSFSVAYDGVSKDINISPKTNGSAMTLTDVYKDFANKLASAFGGTVDIGSNPNNITLKDSYIKFNTTLNSDGTLKGFELDAFDRGNTALGEADKKHSVTVTGMNASKIGIDPGATTQFTTSKKLGELVGVQGQEYKFSINGVDFSFSGNDSVSKVVSTINSSKAGVRISYSSISDKFTLASTNTGANYSINMNQSKGNLLGALLGDVKGVAIEGAKETSGIVMTSDSIKGFNGGTIGSMDTVKFVMKVDGASKTFALNKKDDGTAYSSVEIKNAFNEWLGTLGLAYDDSTNAITYAKDSDGNQVKTHPVIEFDKTTIDINDPEALKEAQKSDLALVLGFNVEYKNNIAKSANDMADNVKDLLIRAKLATKAADGTITLKADVCRFDEDSGRIVLIRNLSPYAEDGSATSSQKKIMTARKELFGSANPTVGNGAAIANVQGKDALIEVDGTKLTRSSNEFTVNGVTMKATAEPDPADPTSTVSATITTERDVDKIVKGFTEFVKDYNEMVTKLRDYTDAEPSYQSYEPLTDKQRDQMSEKQIEKWEEKAKEGLLRRDNDINTFLSQLRTALYTKPDASNLALYDIGVETADKEGTLSFDEAALRRALSSDPDSVKALFLDATSGLSGKITKIMDATAKLSTASPGTLVAKAGMKNYLEKNNTLYWDIEKIKDKISDLNNKYEQQRQRYWNQFNQMESIMSNFNTQSSYLSSTFGG